MNTDNASQSDLKGTQKVIEEAYLDGMLDLSEGDSDFSVTTKKSVRLAKPANEVRSSRENTKQAVQVQAPVAEVNVHAEIESSGNELQGQADVAEVLALEEAAPENISEPAATLLAESSKSSEAAMFEAANIEAAMIKAAEEEKIRDSQTVIKAASTDSQAEQEEHLSIPFMCQLFTVLGLKLGLPLSAFSRVIEWPENILPVSDSAEHVVGRYTDNQREYEIIDIAGLIIPARKGEALTNKLNKKYSGILLLMDGRTGIACETYADTVIAKPKTICWRSENSSRRWLAGTVKQGGYALLDIDGVMALLD